MKQQLNGAIAPQFDFVHTTYEAVLDLIHSLDNKSSPGMSGIPVSVLKACSTTLARPLTDIYNNCIRTSVFPREWKTAIVTPLYKNKGQADDMNNYRSISVLSPLAKIFEKILAKQMTIHFETSFVNFDNKLLYDGQHGFRANHSCETALHEIISSCLNNLDKKLISMLH